MTAYDEQQQRFTFDDALWQVLKYDDSPEFRNHLGKQIQGSKAVDFVALGPESTLYLLEIKDYRKDHTPRPEAEVVSVVSQKVRDTLSGLIGLQRREVGPDFLQDWLSRCSLAGCELKVVLWDEEQGQDNLQKKLRAASLRKEIRNKLKWLDVKVLVVGNCLGSSLPGLSVDNLPGAGAFGQSITS